MAAPAIRVFRGDTAVDIEVRKRGHEVSFESVSEEHAYELLDRKLRQRVAQALARGATQDEHEALFHVIDDWWPNRTVAVNVRVEALSAEVVHALHALLAPEYAEWSIAIEVCQGPLSAAIQDLGPVHIYSDVILVTDNEKLASVVSGEA